MKDLFGNETTQEMATKNITGHFQRYRLDYHYRLGTEKENCKNCEHRVSGDYHCKRYHKCELQGLSHSESSDIRLRNTCDNWQPITDNGQGTNSSGRNKEG